MDYRQKKILDLSISDRDGLAKRFNINPSTMAHMSNEAVDRAIAISCASEILPLSKAFLTEKIKGMDEFYFRADDKKLAKKNYQYYMYNTSDAEATTYANMAMYTSKLMKIIAKDMRPIILLENIYRISFHEESARWLTYLIDYMTHRVGSDEHLWLRSKRVDDNLDFKRVIGNIYAYFLIYTHTDLSKNEELIHLMATRSVEFSVKGTERVIKQMKWDNHTFRSRFGVEISKHRLPNKTVFYTIDRYTREDKSIPVAKLWREHCDILDQLGSHASQIEGDFHDEA